MRLANKTYNIAKFKQAKEKIHLLDVKPLTTATVIRLFISYLIIVFWAIVILLPVASLILASFNVSNPKFVTLTPFQFGVDNWTYLFTSRFSNYGQWYWNSMMIAGFTMLITVVFVSFTGFAYSRFKFTGKKSSLSAVMLIQMIPATASLIALFILVKLGRTSLGIDPRVMLIIIYSGGAIAGNTYVLKGYLDTVSKEVDDAARIDGVGNWKLYSKILLPIAKPMLAIVALWSFVGPFSDVILPQLILVEQPLYTLPVGLNTFLSNQAQYVNAGAFAAGAILGSIPTFVLFMYLQKTLVGGGGAGATKG